MHVAVDGRMLAVEGIEPVSGFEFLLQTFLGMELLSRRK